MYEQRPSLKLIEIPMYIGAALYVLISLAVLGFGGFFLASGEAAEAIIPAAMMIFTAFVCFAFAGLMIYATAQLKHRKKWAWITCIVFGAMFAPSAFVFLGIPILIGCLRTEVSSWFNPTDQPQPGTQHQPLPPPSQRYETNDPYQPPRYH